MTRGSRQACQQHSPGSFGTLQIRTDVLGKGHEAAPFTIGVLDRDKPFVHVLDEFSLEVVMAELDTITDFVAYLTARAKFLMTPQLTVVAAGEEQLVAVHIAQGDDAMHPFLPMNKAEGFQREFALLADGYTVHAATANEFPPVASQHRARSNTSARKAKKRKLKLAEASKRRNRQ